MRRCNNELLNRVKLNISSGEFSDDAVVATEQLLDDDVMIIEILKCLASFAGKFNLENGKAISGSNMYVFLKLTRMICQKLFIREKPCVRNKECYTYLAIIIGNLLTLDNMLDKAWDLCRFYLKREKSSHEIASNVGSFCYVLSKEKLSLQMCMDWISRLSTIIFKDKNASATCLVLCQTFTRNLANDDDSVTKFMKCLAEHSKSLSLNVKGRRCVIQLCWFCIRSSVDYSTIVNWLSCFKNASLDVLISLLNMPSDCTGKPLDFKSVIKMIIENEEIQNEDLFVMASTILYQVSSSIKSLNKHNYDAFNFMEACNDLFSCCRYKCSGVTGKLLVKIISDALFASFVSIKWIKKIEDLTRVDQMFRTTIGNFFWLPIELSQSNFEFGAHLMLEAIKHATKLQDQPRALKMSLSALLRMYLACRDRPDVCSLPFQLLCYNLLKQAVANCSKEKEAKMILTCVLALSSLPQKLTVQNPFNAWAQIKNNFPSLTKLSIKEVIDYQLISESSWPRSAFESLDIQKLMMNELMSYVKYPLLKGTAVKGSYKLMFKYVINRSFLAVCMCAAVDSLTADPEMQGREEIDGCITSLQNLRKVGLESADEGTDLLLQGCLWYSLARCHLFKILKTASIEVGQINLRVEKKQEPPPVYVTDSGDVENAFNGPSMYGSMKYDNFGVVLKDFQEALRLWKLAVHKPMSPFPEASQLTLELITSLGYILRIFKQQEEEVTVWNLLICISKKLHIDKYTVIGVAELLDTCRVNVDDQLINLAQDILSSHSFYKSTFYYFTFHICLTKYKILTMKCGPENGTPEYDFIEGMRFSGLTIARKNATLALLKTDSVRIQVAVQQISKTVQNKEWGSFGERCLVYSVYIECTLRTVNWFNAYGDGTKCRGFINLNVINNVHSLGATFRVCELISSLLDYYLMCVKCDDALLYLKVLELILKIPKTIEGTVVEVNACPKLLTEQCFCFDCTHIEYLEAVMRFLDLKALYLSIKTEIKSAVKAYEESNVVLSKLKNLYKRFPSCSRTAEVVVRHYLTASISLHHWNQIEKASKYILKAEIFLSHLTDPSVIDIPVCLEKLRIAIAKNPPSLSCSVVCPIKEVTSYDKWTNTTPKCEMKSENFLDAPAKVKFTISSTPESGFVTPSKAKCSLFHSSQPDTEIPDHVKGNVEGVFPLPESTHQRRNSLDKVSKQEIQNEGPEGHESDESPSNDESLPVYSQSLLNTAFVEEHSVSHSNWESEDFPNTHRALFSEKYNQTPAASSKQRLLSVKGKKICPEPVADSLHESRSVKMTTLTKSKKGLLHKNVSQTTSSSVLDIDKGKAKRNTCKSFVGSSDFSNSRSDKPRTRTASKKLEFQEQAASLSALEDTEQQCKRKICPPIGIVQNKFSASVGTAQLSRSPELPKKTESLRKSKRH